MIDVTSFDGGVMEQAAYDEECCCGACTACSCEVPNSKATDELSIDIYDEY